MLEQQRVMSRRGNGLGMFNGLEWRDKMKGLKVHQEKHYLMWEDGTPFFYLGDTAWELFHRLDREEVAEYLERRAAQGFHVVQAAGLSAGKAGGIVFRGRRV